MKKILGLDISDYSIEVLELKKIWGGFKALNYARVELVEELVEDGKIKQIQKLALKIKALLKQAYPKAIKSKEVVLSLPESKVFLYFLKSPQVKSIEDAIKEQLPQNIPFPLEAVYYDWRKVNSEVMVIATPKVIVDEYLELLNKIELKPLALTLESLSAARAILYPLRNKETACLLDIGARTTLIAIFDKQGLRYGCNFPQAGIKITETLAQQLNLSLSEAEKLKLKQGLELSEVRSSLEQIIQEIKKIFDFYEKKYNQRISKIILTGGSANLKKLPQYLKERFNLEIILGDPLKNIKNSAILKGEQNKVLFTNVVGLALLGLDKKYQKKSINLLP